MIVSDVMLRVRRTFGDEAAVQVTDDDLIRCVNYAQVEIIKLKMDKKVDTNEFIPVRLIVFGMTGIILVSVLCTLLYIIGLKNK